MRRSAALIPSRTIERARFTAADVCVDLRLVNAVAMGVGRLPLCYTANLPSSLIPKFERDARRMQAIKARTRRTGPVVIFPHAILNIMY